MTAGGPSAWAARRVAVLTSSRSTLSFGVFSMLTVSPRVSRSLDGSGNTMTPLALPSSPGSSVASASTWPSCPSATFCPTRSRCTMTATSYCFCSALNRCEVTYVARGPCGLLARRTVYASVLSLMPPMPESGYQPTTYCRPGPSSDSPNNTCRATSRPSSGLIARDDHGRRPSIVAVFPLLVAANSVSAGRGFSDSVCRLS